MINGFIYFSNLISPVFYKIVYMSIVGSVLGMAILCITKLFDSKLSAKTKCLMWLIPLLFLMTPVNRIQITTTKDFGITSVMTKLEDSLNEVPMAKENNAPTSSEEIQNQSMNQENAPIVQQEEKIASSKMNATNRTITIYEILPMLWFFGMGMSIVMVLLGNVLLNRRVSHAINLQDSGVRLILMKCKRRLQITKKVEIRLHNQNVSPCIYGILKPKILVSEEFLKNSSSEVIENVFLHELSHYKRKDMITNYILLIMTAIHWFNPFVYRFFKKIRQEMELATDEIALSRMDGEEKKQYGRTLIDLLQTYETERITTKLLCITDDNKNMERRIRKIKLSTKLKKYKTSIVVFATLMVLCLSSLFIIKPTNAKMISKNEQALYKQVKQYIMDLEKKEHFSKEKDSQTFIDMQELGVIQQNDETNVYVWALVQSYYYVQGKLEKDESSMPYKFTIKDGVIIGYAIPKDGDQYEESLEGIFPKEIRDKMKESEKLIDVESLEKQAEAYYQDLERETPYVNENAEVASIDKLAGNWQPYKAEDEDGNEMNIRDVYGSGVTIYGGELVIKDNGSYTELIGVYSEDEIDRLQGTCEVYGNGEKGVLISQTGETKTVEIIEDGNDSLEILKVTSKDGISVYFSKLKNNANINRGII